MIFEAIKEILLELGIPEEEIKEEALLKSDLALDSTETVQIALEMKRHFNAVIKLESNQDFSIKAVIEMVNNQLTEKVKA
ncbi:acyl carrier protein [Priestia sp. JNUCC 25]